MNRMVGPLANRTLSLADLVKVFWPQMTLTWGSTLLETGLLALIPLLIGNAIDGLLANDMVPFLQLAGVLFAVVALGVGRRLYDTRAYGSMRVELGQEVVQRASGTGVSSQNARLGMARELVDFLEAEAPVAVTSGLATLVSVGILWSFHPRLALSAGIAFALMVTIYLAFDKRFFNLNGELNHRLEDQVDVLSSASPTSLREHLQRLRKSEVRLSDTEGIVYGLIFIALLGFVLFNLWFATQHVALTAGKMFAVVTYSWEFVESALVLPATLQSLSRLSEIESRVNADEQLREAST